MLIPLLTIRRHSFGLMLSDNVLSPVSLLLPLPEESRTSVLLASVTLLLVELAVEAPSSSCLGVANASGESFMMSKCRCCCSVIERPLQNKNNVRAATHPLQEGYSSDTTSFNEHKAVISTVHSTSHLYHPCYIVPDESWSRTEVAY
jgi:hypothetical protein